jgi:hypothetical protein
MPSPAQVSIFNISPNDGDKVGFTIHGGADMEMNARSDVRTHPIGMRSHEIYRNLASAPSPR